MEANGWGLFVVGAMLIAASLGKSLAGRWHQPAVLGQILAGVVLGMIGLEKTALIGDVAEIGVIFLLFLAGIETDVASLKASGRSSTLIALGGVLAPGLLTGFAVHAIGGTVQTAVFLGLISTATSVGISVQTLREIGRIRTKEGVGILGAAIIDDVVGILLLSLVVALWAPNAGESVGLVLGKILVFFLLVVLLKRGMLLLLSVFQKTLDRRDLPVHLALIACFFMAFLSEELGVAAITGAYFCGVIFSESAYRQQVSEEADRLGRLFFIPIFFVSLGMGIDLGVALSALGLGLLLIVLGVFGKLFGCFAGARLSGFSTRGSLQVGIGMIPRAEVTMIMANLGLRLGFLTDHHLAAVLVMVLGTTLVTPGLLSWSFLPAKPIARHA